MFEYYECCHRNGFHLENVDENLLKPWEGDFNSLWAFSRGSQGLKVAS